MLLRLDYEMSLVHSKVWDQNFRYILGYSQVKFSRAGWDIS